MWCTAGAGGTGPVLCTLPDTDQYHRVINTSLGWIHISLGLVWFSKRHGLGELGNNGGVGDECICALSIQICPV